MSGERGGSARLRAVVAPIAAPVRRAIRRTVRQPFEDAQRAPLIVHCPHHKVGTVWFKHVLRGVANHWGLRFDYVNRATQPPRGDIVVYQSTRRFDRHVIGDRGLRGSHLVRDPRDVVVSGYYYHLRTDERWAHMPSERWGGRTYQEHLRELSEHDGLLAEMDRATSPGGALADMAEWDYTQPDFLELRYEDVFGNERESFYRLFRHFTFRPDQAERAAEIADRFSFARRPVNGSKNAGSHVRSGQPGEWRDVFTAEHRLHFKAVTGDLLQRLGYEDAADW